MLLTAVGPDDRYTTRMLGPPDLQDLQSLFERAGDYFELATGQPPASDEAPRAFVAGPPTKSVNDKRVVGIYEGNTLVGVLDAITDWPADGTWTVGMLLLDPAHRSAGLGSAVLSAFESYAASDGAKTLRTALVEHHERGRVFLERAGYVADSTPPGAPPDVPSAVIVFTKSISRGKEVLS